MPWTFWRGDRGERCGLVAGVAIQIRVSPVLRPGETRLHQDAGIGDDVDLHVRTRRSGAAHASEWKSRTVAQARSMDVLMTVVL